MLSANLPPSKQPGGADDPIAAAIRDGDHIGRNPTELFSRMLTAIEAAYRVVRNRDYRKTKDATCASAIVPLLWSPYSNLQQLLSRRLSESSLRRVSSLYGRIEEFAGFVDDEHRDGKEKPDELASLERILTVFAREIATLHAEMFELAERLSDKNQSVTLTEYLLEHRKLKRADARKLKMRLEKSPKFRELPKTFAAQRSSGKAHKYRVADLDWFFADYPID